MQKQIVEIFRQISAIPRMSGHEAAVSKFLTGKVKALGLPVKQDAWGNVIAEKPASVGREEEPIVILQAHMDMVCVASEGTAYDPLRDAIQVEESDGYLSAAGTSLGADDGIGVAVILYLLGADFSHGPLRAIFTVDEENGMTGAKNLAQPYLEADYLINCDSEDVDTVTVSSAGSVNIDFSLAVTERPPLKALAFKIGIKGLAGGHSGTDINDGRANAIKLLGFFLDKMLEKGVDFELADIAGGTARNAIPAYAEASICIDAQDKASVLCVVDEMNAYLKGVYGSTEPSAEAVPVETALPARVVDTAARERLLRLIMLLHTGVYAAPGYVVETSANLGVIKKSVGKVEIQFFPRSSVDEKLTDFVRMGKAAAAAAGARLTVSALSPAWPERRQGKLTDIVCEEFAKITGAPMKKERIHAGLECSFFYQKNKKLDMISIGPTVTDAHSPNEKLALPTLDVHVRTIINTLARLK